MIPRPALLLLVLVMTCARADQPGADYTQDTDNYPSFVSPDGQLQVENYFHTNQDGDDEWQFWVFDREHKNGWLLNAKPNPDYGAGFRFTSDSQWLVRMQKIGAGSDTIYLYRRDGHSFSKGLPLGDLAWNYFWSRPESAKVRKPDIHLCAHLVKGLEDNYSWLSKTWPKNRYVVINLYGESTVEPRCECPNLWFCAYDLQKETFVVLPEFKDRNVKALAPQ